MTEMVTGMSQGIDTPSQPVNSSSSQQGSSSQSPQGNSTPVERQNERLFRQDEVNDIVKKVKQESIDSYRRMQSERPDYVQQKYGDTPYSPHNQPAFDDSHYRKIASEEAQRLRDEWVKEIETKSQEEMAQRTVQNFWNKINPGKEKYQDFDQITSDIQYGRFPNVVRLLGDYIDNSHDVLYELAKDRTKMANLETLALMSPQDAIVQAQRLAKSIKDNESNSKMRIPNEPLSQVRPSNAATDSGVMSVRDFRNKYKV